jgi:hypothetical protein
MTYDFEIIGDHPHAGKRVRVVEGSAPGMVQGTRPVGGGAFMALVEDAEGNRYYAGREDLGRVEAAAPLGANWVVREKRGKRR